MLLQSEAHAADALGGTARIERDDVEATLQEWCEGAIEIVVADGATRAEPWTARRSAIFFCGGPRWSSGRELRVRL